MGGQSRTCQRHAALGRAGKFLTPVQGERRIVYQPAGRAAGGGAGTASRAENSGCRARPGAVRGHGGGDGGTGSGDHNYSAVVHLAGGMGRPAWLLTPWLSDWRWLLGREDSPWYPTSAALPPGQGRELGKRRQARGGRTAQGGGRQQGGADAVPRGGRKACDGGGGDHRRPGTPYRVAAAGPQLVGAASAATCRTAA